MKVEKGTVRAPEIGRIWLNSSPLSLHQLRGKAVLIDFWDYTCVNCLRTLPYVQAWHERYKDLGLVVVGVHTPEFTFAQYEANVERGIREFGLTYPVVIDGNRELWNTFANRYWPAKYLIDKEGYLRWAHFGEGAYVETEQAIQELLREISPGAELPAIMAPVRDSDMPGAVCYPPTAELYLGNARGRIGNLSGFVEGQVSDYAFDGPLTEGVFYLQGRWASTREFCALDSAPGKIALKYSASGVNLVMASTNGRPIPVGLRQDGKPLTAANATQDVQQRDGRSFVDVQNARMYRLVENHDFGTHTLELLCAEPGLAAFAFTFTSCVDPERSAVAQEAAQ
ncbi:MAG: redoxin domain-containing protein [Candidatus Koribacter versatilis]|uniref:Redoxin domain-containing protein n=1 Tax=Candidatus Korobacter versatilis TaxID=658062 RepID=A0A932ENM1_9BACT|nr:redoxin domain-containing protein [Candidatus Koribacter versatilis]